MFVQCHVWRDVSSVAGSVYDPRSGHSDPSSPSYIYGGGGGGSSSHSDEERQTSGGLHESLSSSSLGTVTAFLPNAQRSVVSDSVIAVYLLLDLIWFIATSPHALIVSRATIVAPHTPRPTKSTRHGRVQVTMVSPYPVTLLHRAGAPTRPCCYNSQSTCYQCVTLVTSVC